MIIGITGGKGGTGKSTIATALAYALTQQGKKVLLVDADVDCPNDALILGAENKLLKRIHQRIPRWDFDKCTKCGLCGEVCKTNAIVSIKDKKPIFMPLQCNGCGACYIKCPVKAISWSEKEIGYIYRSEAYGIDILSGELKVNEPVSEFIVDGLKEIIDIEKSKFDHIIIDTAAGTHCDVIAALGMCEVAFAVTEPTPLGVHDLALILDLFEKLKISGSIVLNRSDVGDRGLVEKLAKKFGVKVVAEVPYDKKIVDCYSNAKPLIIKDMDKIIGLIK